MSDIATQGSTLRRPLWLAALAVGALCACTSDAGGPDAMVTTDASLKPKLKPDAHAVDARTTDAHKTDARVVPDAAMHTDAGPDALVSDAHVTTDVGSTSDAHSASDAQTDASMDAGASSDALPPGTVTVLDLEQHMFPVANGAADHCATVGSHQLCGGSCNGTCAGTTALSTYAIATDVLTPAMPGGPSSRVDVTNPRCDAGPCGSDTLEWVKVDPAPLGTGQYASDTHFVWDFYFYPTSTTHVQAYEFDAFYGANGWWLMMGSQCDLASGNWNGWDQATGHWIPSSIEGCGSFFTVNAWNHVVIRYHRDPGTVGASTQYYYDGLEVNGVSHTWGLPGYTGTKNGWGDVVGVQVQQDLEASFTTTLSSYYEAFTFEISR